MDGREEDPAVLVKFQDHIQKALSWVKYDSQMPTLIFLEVEFASIAAEDATGGAMDKITDEAMAASQQTSALPAKSKNFHHFGKGSTKGIVDARSAS